ncbi:MAG: hypothetical protein WAL22_13695, partial [Solirubrobacteraceae bacterium]
MRLWPALITLAAGALAGCGSGSAATSGRVATSAAATPAAATHRPGSAAPPPVHLELELPLVGLSPAPVVSYATTAARPMIRGVVQPAGATVYMQGP